MPRILTPADVAAFQNRLCDVGMQLFVERGFEGFHMRELANRLGVSAMTPYRYFKDKEEIMAEIRVRAFARFADWLQEHLLGSDVDGSSLSRAYMRFATQEPAQYRLMFDLIQPTSSAIPALAVQERRVRDALMAHLRLWTGHDVSSDELELQGQILWSILHGTTTLYLSGKLSVEDLSRTLSNAVRQFIGCTVQAKDNTLDFAFGNGRPASWWQSEHLPSTPA